MHKKYQGPILKLHVEYDYLTTYDLDWLFKIFNDAKIQIINIGKKNFGIKSSRNVQFTIKSASTEHSILIELGCHFLHDIDGSYDFVRDVYNHIRIKYESSLTEKQLKGRYNISKISIEIAEPEIVQDQTIYEVKEKGIELRSVKK